MAVTIRDVEYIAQLARLEFSEKEKEILTEQMNQILNYMAQLNTLNTENVPPLSHVLEIQNVFRDDVVKESTPTAEVLKNAPSATEEFFRVPKVIGEKE